MSGILYGVGVGPGDPEMMTLKAVRTIKEADVLCLPHKVPEQCRAYSIAASVIPKIADKAILALDFKMSKDQVFLEKMHRDHYEKCKEYLLSGKNIAFLTIGDPTIYSTFGYIMELAKKDGFDVELINSVTSFCGAAAASKISLSLSDENIHILSGQSNIDDFLKMPGTKIIMKSGRNIGKIKRQLIDLENDHHVKIYAVADCGLETEHIFISASEIPEQTTYMITIIIKSA